MQWARPEMLKAPRSPARAEAVQIGRSVVWSEGSGHGGAEGSSLLQPSAPACSNIREQLGRAREAAGCSEIVPEPPPPPRQVMR
jgi:hypothetical protein